MTYNQTVLERYSALLYSLSIANAVCCSIGGAILGGVAFAGLVSESNLSIVTGGVIGTAVGAGYGWVTSFLLRVVAQLVLCLVNIEANTRKPFSGSGEAFSGKPSVLMQDGPKVSQQAASSRVSDVDDRSVIPEARTWPVPAPAPVVRDNPQTRERTELENLLIAKFQKAADCAITTQQFDVLVRKLQSAGAELQSALPESIASPQWNDFIDQVERGRRQSVINARKADDESSCRGCRGRLSMYEASLHMCSRCQHKAAEFDKVIAEA